MLTVIQKFSHSLCHSGQIVRTSSISDWHLTTRKEGMVATYRTLKGASPSTQRCEFPSTLAAANLLFACDQQQNVIGHGVGGFCEAFSAKKNPSVHDKASPVFCDRLPNSVQSLLFEALAAAGTLGSFRRDRKLSSIVASKMWWSRHSSLTQQMFRVKS